MIWFCLSVLTIKIDSIELLLILVHLVHFRMSREETAKLKTSEAQPKTRSMPSKSEKNQAKIIHWQEMKPVWIFLFSTKTFLCFPNDAGKVLVHAEISSNNTFTLTRKPVKPHSLELTGDLSELL